MTQHEPDHYTPQPMGTGGGAGYGGSYPSPGMGEPRMRPVYVPLKSVLISYILWFFLGQIGAHKFYLRSPLLGIFYILLAASGYALAGIGIGFILLVPLWLLLVIDLITIPFRVGILNARATVNRW